MSSTNISDLETAERAVYLAELELMFSTLQAISSLPALTLGCGSMRTTAINNATETVIKLYREILLNTARDSLRKSDLSESSG